MMFLSMVKVQAFSVLQNHKGYNSTFTSHNTLPVPHASLTASRCLSCKRPVSTLAG